MKRSVTLRGADEDKTVTVTVRLNLKNTDTNNKTRDAERKIRKLEDAALINLLLPDFFHASIKRVKR